MTKILVLGARGQVGSELRSTLKPLGTVHGVDLPELNLTHPDAIRRFIRDTKPEIIVNAAAYTAVDQAERESAIADKANGDAPGILAEEAKRLEAILVHYSTDYVFDGKLDRTYTEDDTPNPVNAYGRSKLKGELAIKAVGGQYLILRSSWIYSRRPNNFVQTVLHLAHEKTELPMVDDQFGSPTWARWLADATAELLRKRHVILQHHGIYHLAGSGHATRYEFAKSIIETMMQLTGNSQGWATLRPITTKQYPLPAARPPRPVMCLDKVQRVFGIALRPWRDQLHDFLLELAKDTRLGV